MQNATIYQDIKIIEIAIADHILKVVCLFLYFYDRTLWLCTQYNVINVLIS